jgi:hypothetical protein
VTVESSEESLTIHADPTSGVSPLETILSIDASFEVAASTLLCDGPGEIETVLIAPQQYRLRMTVEGLYYFDVEVLDSQGVSHSGTVAVMVLDTSAIDALLVERWEEMKAALAAGRMEVALEHHHKEARTRYEAIYAALGSDLPVLVEQMQEISPVYFEQSRAKYRIRRDQDIAGQTVTVTYYVYFSMDGDGIWKIENY